MQSWHVGVSPWIIQDGNYGDFHLGQLSDFALEFYAPELRASPKGSPSALYMGAGKYQISAKVLKATKPMVLDFGIKAYSDQNSPLPKTSMAEGALYLGIDSYSYFEYHALRPTVPSLIYRWKIEEIQKQTAPLIQRGQILVEDETRLVTTPVQKTDAWHDEEVGLSVHYVLVCTLQSSTARRVRRLRNL